MDETAEITIRRASPADAAAVVAIFSQPSVVAGTLQLPHASVDQWRERLKPQDDHYQIVACATLSGGESKVVGLLGLHRAPHVRRRHCAHIGMAIHEEWQRQGVGTALLAEGLQTADEWFGFTRVELTVFADNEPALTLYTRFGFVVEGRLREYALREGTYEDVFTMARLLGPEG